MADLVVRNLEALVDELNDIESKGLFSRQEIRAIANKRKTFEYSVNKRGARKEDFLKYIQYEINLDCLLKKRRKMLGIREKRNRFGFTTVRHIHQLFQLASRKFKGDVNLWIQHAQYCHKSGSYRKLGQVYGTALQYHPHNTGLWIAAAKAEFEVDKNVSAARNVMLKGLRLNPESKSLWWEYFRFEMLYVDKIRKRRKVLGSDEDPEDVSDEILQYKAAFIVFRNALTAIPSDPTFCLKFLEICRLFEQTTGLQEDIYSVLEAEFSASEEALNALSRRPFDALEYQTSQRRENVSVSDGLKAKEDCIILFKKALLKLPTTQMWDFCLGFCFERLTDESKVSKEFNMECLQMAVEFLDEASSKRCLSEHFSLQRIDLFLNVGLQKLAIKSALDATEVHSSSVALWHKCLSLHSHALLEPTGEVFRMFELAIQSVQREVSLSLWTLWIEFCQTHAPEETEPVYMRSCESHKSVADSMKISYIEWALITHGLVKTRDVYKKLIKSRPVALELYRKCIQLEKLQDTPDVKAVRALYTQALDDYGSVSSDLWIDNMQFELAEGNGEVVSEIQWRAIKTLKGTSVSSFVEKCTCLR